MKGGTGSQPVSGMPGRVPWVSQCGPGTSSVLVCVGRHITTTDWGWWFKEQKCIFSQFWRLGVCEQGVGRVGSAKSSPWRTDGCLLAVPTHGLPPVHVLLLVSPPHPMRTPVLWGEGPTLMTSLKALTPNTDSKVLGLRASTWEFWGRGEDVF